MEPTEHVSFYSTMRFDVRAGRVENKVGVEYLQVLQARQAHGYLFALLDMLIYIATGLSYDSIIKTSNRG